MTNGASSSLNVEPRNFCTRRFLCDTPSTTRWLSTTAQSTMNCMKLTTWPAVPSVPSAFAVMRAGQFVGEQPLVQPVDLPAPRRIIRQKRQYDVDGIEDDASCAHLFDLGSERGEHAGEIEIARLNQLGGRARVEKEQLFRCNSRRFQPKPSKLATSRSGLSSNATKMPGTPLSRAA